MWKSDLYAAVDANRNVVRDLQQAGLVRVTEEVRFRDPLRGRIYPPTQAPPLTDEQAAVWEQILTIGFDARSPQAGRGPARKFLIHGVTGSGKTEIYLRAIQEVLSRDGRPSYWCPKSRSPRRPSLASQVDFRDASR